MAPYLNAPPDAQLPELEQRLRRMLEDVQRNLGVQDIISANIPDVQPDILYLFNVRYQIEKELLRIYSQRKIERDQHDHYVPYYQITRYLVEVGLIDPRLASVIREIYFICSPAIHGQETTQQKVNFVRDIAPNVIATIRAIQ